jgi:hypothetical protein
MAAKTDTERAKLVLRAKLGRPSWLRGIGLGGEPGDYCIKVNVAELTNEVRASLPKTVDGVPVQVEAVGTLRPRRR